MTSQKVVVMNTSGLHARPAALFVKSATSFKSDITVAKDGKSGNAKSLLSLLALGIQRGHEIAIGAAGEDEAAAVAALVKLVESKFGE
jgi:phosphocarrier protein HPr